VNEGLYQRVRAVTRNRHAVWVYVYARPLPAGAFGPLSRWRPRADCSDATSSVPARGVDHAKEYSIAHQTGQGRR
jgi:hypothetical protein